MHNISSIDYQKQFPNSPIMCQEVIDMKSKSISASSKNKPPVTDETKRKMAIKCSARWKQLKDEMGEEAYYAMKRKTAEDMRAAKGDNFQHSEETKQKMRGPRPNAKHKKSDETKRKLSDAAKRRPIRGEHKPETIEKMKAAWERRKLDTAVYDLYIKETSARMTTPESVARMRDNVAKRLSNPDLAQKQYDTKPELEFKRFLDLHDIKYNCQHIIPTTTGSWTYDFIIIDKNILVEIDGEYWHTKSKEQVNRDIIKSKIARDNGYILARISDKDFNLNIIFESADKIWDQNNKILSARLLKFT